MNPPRHPMCSCTLPYPDRELGEIVGYRTFTDIWNGQFVEIEIAIREPQPTEEA